MKRLGIFCFYDPDGIFYNSDNFLLSELRSVIDYLIVVVNGTITDNGLLLVSKQADDIIVRENEGFDAAAYNAAFEFIQYNFSIYDELVLCNNSFFGPFIHFSVIFDRMQNFECDFWGLKLDDINLRKTIESYFLVLKKTILNSKVLENYFKTEVRNIFTYHDCCEIFEAGLFQLLTQQNHFSYAVYAKPTNFNAIFSGDYELIDAGLPILKRKFFTKFEENKKNILRALYFVASRSDYDISFILEKIVRIQGKSELRYINGITSVSSEELEECIKDKEFYIYGTGSMAQLIYKSCCGDKTLFLGFIVSDEFYTNQISHFCSYPVYKLSQIKDKSVIIIVGLNKENTLQVIPKLFHFPNAINLWQPLAFQKKSFEKLDSYLRKSIYSYSELNNLREGGGTTV